MDNTIGELLKRRRENLGYTLDKVHVATKISVNFIIAIEANEWDKFPARVYLRGFLKKYSEYLELDTQEILRMFDHPPEISEPKSIQQGAKDGIKDIFGRLGKYITQNNDTPVKYAVGIVTGAVLVVLLVIYVIDNYDFIDFSSGKNVISAISVKTSSVTVPSNTQPAGKKYVLTIKVFVDTWIRVTLDGKKEFEGIVYTNKNYRWDAGEAINLKVGYVRGIDAMLDGEHVDLLSGARQGVNEVNLPVKSN
ncbi:MAG: RodZ domain-containing protein [Elusimicrobiota bacterium]